MNKRKIGRRDFFRRATVAALTAAEIVLVRPGQAQEAVPNSSGTEPPKLKAPATAITISMIFDSRRLSPAAGSNRTRV